VDTASRELAGVTLDAAIAAMIWRRRQPNQVGPASAPTTTDTNLQQNMQAQPRWQGVIAVATLLASGAAVYSSWLSQQSVDATLKELAITRHQLALAERGQVSDRLGRAAEQLDADTMHGRLGGIYGMEQLMRDAPDEQPRIIEMLSAFIRIKMLTAEKKTKRVGEKPWWLCLRTSTPLSLCLAAACTVTTRTLTPT